VGRKGRFVECYFGWGAGLNKKLAVDVAQRAITARVSATPNCSYLLARAQLRNLLACDSLLVVDEICALGQRFGHLESSRKCYDSIMMGEGVWNVCAGFALTFFCRKKKLRSNLS
jgi:hypothetical protein